MHCEVIISVINFGRKKSLKILVLNFILKIFPNSHLELKKSFSHVPLNYDNRTQENINKAMSWLHILKFLESDISLVSVNANQRTYGSTLSMRELHRVLECQHKPNSPWPAQGLSFVPAAVST